MAADFSGVGEHAASLALKMGSAAVDAISFMTGLGEELPIVKPVLMKLMAVREKVETVRNNREELAELHERCTYMTACLIVKYRQNLSVDMDVAAVEDCVEATLKFIERCNRRGKVSRVLSASSDKDVIAALKTRVDNLTGDLGLAGIAVLEKAYNMATTLQAVLEPPQKKLATVPEGAPMRKSWYVERRNVVDKVFKTLTGGTGPRLVGLVGASGSGKTTTASEIVRTAQVREAFSDGIVWLSANDGARGRLHALTLQLARMVFEDIMGSVGRRPSESEDPAAYVKTCMKMAHGGKGKGMKCLVVADNVCEEEVISKLVETGMWILLTTRDGELVKGGHGEAVEVDKLSAADAESVLRRAAELPPRARLPDDAIDIIEMCNGVAMDLAFVGRWSTVRGRQDRAAWSDAANKIREEIRKFEADSRAESSRSIHRKAILQAGFEDLAVGSDDVRVQRLYLSLAVLPDGHAFTLKDAAVLLYDRTPGAEDEASVGQVVGILERWNIIRSIQGIYRMHDAHSIFARENLMDSGDVRLPALFRWAKYISSLEFLRSVDGYVLKGLWLAVERVGGKGWADTRPYKAALIEMDDSDPLLRQSIEAVMLFEEVEEDWEAATATGRRLLDAEKRELGADHPYILNSYQRLAVWAERLGNVKEAAEWRENEREALPLVLARMRPQSDSGTKDGADDAGGLVSLAATMLDLTPEENDGAEKLLRRALEIQEADLGQAEVEMASTLYELALRACRARAVRDRQAGRLKEAEELLRDCLKIEESKQRGDRKDARLASTLHELGVCVRQAEKLEEAEDILRRCLGIKEEQFGPENVQVASTLRELVICVQKAGQRGEARRLEETEQLLRRCLDTKKEKLASTLEQLGVCVRGAGRLAEAEDLLRRCLAIKETLGLEHVQVASTLHLLGSCVSEAGKLEEGEELLMRCLAIKEMTLGPEHLQVASTLHALGSCVSEAGRWEEGERLLRRCLAIQAAKLGTEDARMASTLHELGVCASQAGRLDEAEQLLRRSLRIQEAKLGAGDEQVGSTLNELSICVRQAGRLEEAEELTGRWRENEEERIGKEEDKTEASVSNFPTGSGVAGDSIRTADDLPVTLLENLEPGSDLHVCESRGVRLSVPGGALPTNIGPIVVKDTAEVVHSSEGPVFVVTQVVGCLPSSVAFNKPLKLDFVVDNVSVVEKNRPAADKRVLSEHQVFFKQNEYDPWQKMDPGELSVEWNEQGAPRLRAQVKHFCCFGYATAPDEDGCTVTQHWGNSVAVVNATNCVAHLTQFSTSFETGSERTNSCTLTFCDASASFATAKKTEQVLLPNIGPSETVTRRTTLYEATGGKRMQLIVCFLPDRVIPARAVPAPGTQDTLVSRVRALGGWSRHSSSPGAGVQTASPSVSTSPLPGARTPAAVTTSATSPHPGGMGPQAAATACAAANSVTLLQPGAKATQPAATTSVTSQHPGGTGPQPAATSAPTAPQPRVAGSQGAATSSVTSPQPAGVGTQVAPFSSVASPSPGTEDGSEEMVYCLKKIVPMWSRLTILPDIMEPHMINRRIKIKKYAHALETYAMMLAEFGVTVPPQPGS